MRNTICFIIVSAVLVLASSASRAALVDTSTLVPAPPPAEHAKVETECPPGSFKFDGTCWIQGDCPEGEAVFRQGLCVPIPNWRYSEPEDEPEPAPPPAPEPKTEEKPKK